MGEKNGNRAPVAEVSRMSTECAGCLAREAEVLFLRKQNADLVDKMLALASPAALAVARGQMPPFQTPQVTPSGQQPDVVDEQGRGFVWYDGNLVPLTEYQRLQEKVAQMSSGG